MYYRNEEETKATWKDGWYHTGDLAWKDEDGFYWYVGRKDDVIKSSGYRIGPFEIESVLMELPYVLECGVSPAKDPVRGFVVKASIVLVPGVEGTDALVKEIQNYVKEHTAPYKYPRIVVFKDELPKNDKRKDHSDMNYKRITLLCGHYGSGKTNIAVNMALDLRKQYERVAVADLDIVNPYFRTLDSRTIWRTRGSG